MNVLDTVSGVLGALHFVRPWWFAALIPLAGLLWLLARGRFSGGGWEAVCDAHLLPFMLLGRMINVGRRSFLWLTGLAGVLAVTALAGPAWERLPQPVVRDDSALVVVFDLSLSMDAVDIKPNRLLRARFKINDLIKQGVHGQTGLVVYARDAFTVVPVTDDSAAIELYLQSLDTRLMPRQGSRADLGLQEAGALLQKVDSELGDVLLVSDYADARVVGQARLLNDKGYKVSVLGVGTESGGPVSLPSGDFLSHEGEVVIPRFEENALREVARAGGGAYVHFDPFAGSDVEALNEWFDVHVTTTQSRRESEVSADAWREEGPWLVLLMLPIAAFGFRRGLLALAAVAVGAMLIVPPPAYALSWADLWLRPDQQGERALEEGDAERAAELFENDEWRAAAQYRGGDYAGAVKTLEPLDGAAVAYNKGNALAGAGKLKEAVEAYRDALEINPAMEDAAYNMGVVEQLLQMMQQQQMQQGGEGEEGEEGEQQQAQQQARQQGEQQDQQDGDEPQQDSPSPDESDENDKNESGDEQEGEEQDREENADASEDESGGDGEPAADPAPETMTEKDQAVEQWLRGVPDDPGRLLKRKLRHLSRAKKKNDAEPEKPW